MSSPAAGKVGWPTEAILKIGSDIKSNRYRTAYGTSSTGSLTCMPSQVLPSPRRKLYRCESDDKQPEDTKHIYAASSEFQTVTRASTGAQQVVEYLDISFSRDLSATASSDSKARNPLPRPSIREPPLSRYQQLQAPRI
ncbi:hypothetical protein PTT_15413 [Pyrenophora teres f. teres 0-1]|uniref:Uncharacterized protein n=1 Tax=Pyrenophora teres f. teres (strain 0-1) TaxID=861557 RepID=E3S064_PYRTT|nr:hypothetical protein PTT_15413 [Pyrenophora teres f. teres 0-1]